jgi:hypothetical protein
LVHIRTTQRHIPEDGIIHSHRSENLKSYIVKDMVYKTPVASLTEMKLGIFTAIKRVAPPMLENTWREIEYRLDMLHATKGAHVEAI